jgi:hypothetical protein
MKEELSQSLTRESAAAYESGIGCEGNGGREVTSRVPDL